MFTPVHVAAIYGNAAMMTLLLQYVGNVHVLDEVSNFWENNINF